MQHVSPQLFGEKVPADLYITKYDSEPAELIKHSEAITRKYFTEAEKRWIEFFAYIGLSENDISASLSEVRTPTKIRRYIRAHHEKIQGLRVECKNSIQRAPRYPYVVDTRAPYSVTTDEARAKGFLPEYGIDTGMDWEYVASGMSANSFSAEAKEYFAYLLANLGGWDNLHTRNNILTYYSLFTPETLMYLGNRVTKADVEKYADGAPEPPCPYVFSFRDYEMSHMGRNVLRANSKFYDEDSALLNMSAIERACGGRVSTKAVTLALAWQGVVPDDISSIVPVSMGVSKKSVDKVLSLVRLTFAQPVNDIEQTELLEALPLTPLSPSGGFFDVQTNDLYEPKITFTGLDGREYTLYPWQVSHTTPIMASASNTKNYYVWLQRTYGAQVAARYMALYSPQKSFESVYKASVRRDGWGDTLSDVPPVCPFPIPFEAVYDEAHGLIRYYEHLDINGSSVFRTQDTEQETEEPSVVPEHLGSDLADDLAEMVSEQTGNDTGELEQPAQEEQEPVDEEPPAREPKESTQEAPQSPVGTPDATEPETVQEEPEAASNAHHSGAPNEAIGEYELRPGVIQQVMFTDGDGTRVLKALPGDKKLAIDFALPGIDEHYDHGDASRRAEAEKQAAKHGAFPPLATPPASSPARNVDGITVGELAVKISSPVSKVIWNILHKNQGNLKGSSVATVGKILNAPPIAMVQALADEHGWSESIRSFAQLAGAAPMNILMIFSRQFNGDVPFATLLNLFGISETDALHTLTNPKAGFNVKDIPVRGIADALGKTYETVIVESLNL